MKVENLAEPKRTEFWNLCGIRFKITGAADC